MHGLEERQQEKYDDTIDKRCRRIWVSGYVWEKHPGFTSLSATVSVIFRDDNGHRNRHNIGGVLNLFMKKEVIDGSPERMAKISITSWPHPRTNYNRESICLIVIHTCRHPENRETHKSLQRQSNPEIFNQSRAELLGPGPMAFNFRKKPLRSGSTVVLKKKREMLGSIKDYFSLKSTPVDCSGNLLVSLIGDNIHSFWPTFLVQFLWGVQNQMTMVNKQTIFFSIFE